MAEQIFAHTEPNEAAHGGYVRFLQAFDQPDHEGVKFTFRDESGRSHSIEVLKDKARELAFALLDATGGV